MSQDQPELSIDDLPELCLSIVTRKLPCKDRHMLSRTSSRVYRMCTGDDCEPGLLGNLVLRYFKTREHLVWEIRRYCKQLVPVSFTDPTTGTPTININVSDDSQARVDEVLHYLGRHKNAFESLSIACGYAGSSFVAVDMPSALGTSLTTCLLTFKGSLNLDLKLPYRQPVTTLNMIALMDLPCLATCTVRALDLQSIGVYASVFQRVTGVELDELDTGHILSTSVSFPNVQVLTVFDAKGSFDPTRLFPNLEELQVMRPTNMQHDPPALLFPPGVVLPNLRALVLGGAPHHYIASPMEALALDLPSIAIVCPALTRLELNCSYWNRAIPTVRFPTVKELVVGVVCSGQMNTMTTEADAVLSRLDLPAVETVVLKLAVSDSIPEIYGEAHEIIGQGYHGYPNFPTFHFSLSDALRHIPTTTRDLRIEVSVVSVVSTGYCDEHLDLKFRSDTFTSLRGPQTISLRVSAPPDALAALTDLRALTLDAVFDDELLSVEELLVQASVSFTYAIDLSEFQPPPHMHLVSNEYKQEQDFSDEELPDWPTRTITSASRTWQL